MKRIGLFVAIGFLLVLVYSFTLGPEVVSTKSINENFIEIKREKYRFRHWMWSGILPVYGGFIEDPHFEYSQPALMPKNVRELLGDDKARYQIYDINPFFEDDTFESILVIEYKGKSYEYNVETKKPLALNMNISIENGILIKVFSYNSQIGLLSTDREVGFANIVLPLKNKGEIIFHDFGTSFSEKIFEFLRKDKNYLILKEPLCHDPFSPNRNFYEKEFGKCPELKHVPWEPPN